MATINQIGLRKRAMFFKQAEVGITDVFAQDNAAALSDTDAQGSFSSSGCTVSVAGVGKPDTTTYSGGGDFCIKGVSIAAYGYIRYDVPVISGKTYNFSVWAKRGIQGVAQRITMLASDLPSGTKATIDSTDWTEYTWSDVATATGSGRLHFYTGFNGVAGDELYIDKITIAETD